MLGRGLVLLGLTLSLVAGAASDGAQNALDGAGDGVGNSLEGGSVVVGRHCESLYLIWEM